MCGPGSGSGSHDHHDHPDHHASVIDKSKHPFHEIKEKLKDTHLHDAKVSLIHTK